MRDGLLTIVAGQVGVAPFYNKPTHVYPYTDMTPCQRDYIKRVVRTCADSIKRGVSGDPVGLSVSVQMGGGCIINPMDATGRRVFLKAENVFRAMCELVFSSTVHTDADVRRSVCNIIMQRVSGVVSVNNETARRVGELVDSLAGGSV